MFALRYGGPAVNDAPHLPAELTLYAELTQAVAVVDEHFSVWTPNLLQVHDRNPVRQAFCEKEGKEQLHPAQDAE